MIPSALSSNRRIRALTTLSQQVRYKEFMARRETTEAVADVPGPALATLTQDRFSRPNWIFERKLDGMRILGSRSGATVRIRSRRGADVGASFPEIVDALEAIDTPDFVVDGEVVAFDKGQTSFGRLQPRIHISDPDRARRIGVTVYYYLFDVLHLDGHSTAASRCGSARRCSRTSSTGTTRCGTPSTATPTARTTSARPARPAGRA